VVIPQSKAPGIPAKKLASTAYTGTKQDTVGPAAYNPKYETSKPKSSEVNFESVKIKRKTFEPTVDQKVNPGPGNYDYEVQDAKNFNSNGNYSVF
jgi:hypothetical protein